MHFISRSALLWQRPFAFLPRLCGEAAHVWAVPILGYVKFNFVLHRVSNATTYSDREMVRELLP